nr:hypothetical protein BaRGS_003603 [Batillaria attramentaria]
MAVAGSPPVTAEEQLLSLEDESALLQDLDDMTLSSLSQSFIEPDRVEFEISPQDDIVFSWAVVGSPQASCVYTSSTDSTSMWDSTGDMFPPSLTSSAVYAEVDYTLVGRQEPFYSTTMTFSSHPDLQPEQRTPGPERDSAWSSMTSSAEYAMIGQGKTGQARLGRVLKELKGVEGKDDEGSGYSLKDLAVTGLSAISGGVKDVARIFSTPFQCCKRETRQG